MKGLGQWLNLSALSHSWRALKNPSLIVPHLSVPDIRGIDFVRLKAQGIKAIVLDKDNCLTAPYAECVFPGLEPAWEECKRVFSPHVLIVSNSAGSSDDHTHAAATALASSFGAPFLQHRHKKPGCGEEILTALGLPASQVALVGDRLLTDVLMANMHGMLAVHTQALTVEGDNPAAAVIRRLENRVLSLLCREGVAPPPHPAAPA
eukprot:m.204572 g.204572  ORF g.204572 m.204572 type:complete len:206 (+) comp15530_c0_seq2:1435-2052(+)